MALYLHACCGVCLAGIVPELRKKAVIDIRSGDVLNGSLPRRALSMVVEWRQLHLDELMANWERAHRREPLFYIDPLE